jgi:phosphoglycerate dehydrogenase-like enzyme
MISQEGATPKLTATGRNAYPSIVVLCGETDRPPGLQRPSPHAGLRYAATTEELGEALPGADVLFIWDFRSTKLQTVWARADQLRWVHIASAGIDPLLFPGFVSSSVVLTNSRHVFDDAIAEYVLGLLLAFTKDLPCTLDLQRRRTWRHRVTERLAGRSVLIVGVGPIGQAIARLVIAAGCRVTGVARTPRNDDPDFGTVHPAAALPDALPGADFVVIAAPLTDHTRGMFGAAAFQRMKPSARLINVGRGPIIDQPALVTALRGGQLAGAALDVFADEPLPPDSPLWGMGNVIVSPHMSGDFLGWDTALTGLFRAQLARYRAGEPLANVVDKQLGYVPTR